MSGDDDNILLTFSPSNAERNRNEIAEKPWWINMTRQQIRFSLIFFACIIQAAVLLVFGNSKEQFPVMIGLALIFCLLLAILSATVFVWIVIRKHKRASTETVGRSKKNQTQIL